MSEAIIELKDVWKIYQMGDVDVKALQGLTMSIKKGEFVAIMGPSGSGKSTCVNMVGCLDIPTRGNVYLDKQDISYLHESELAQIRGKKIGFIVMVLFSSCMPFLWFSRETMNENLSLFLIWETFFQFKIAKLEPKLKVSQNSGDPLDSFTFKSQSLLLGNSVEKIVKQLVSRN